MAALRFFARSRLDAIIRPTQQSAESLKNLRSTAVQIHQRLCRYNSTYSEHEGPEKYTDFEVSRDPKEWAYVEHVLMRKQIPVPPQATDLPSGWLPATAKPESYPYFIRRTKNYMHPVYLLVTYRGMRRVTVIKHIYGDIWALEAELKDHLEKIAGKEIGIIVNELVGYIKFRGDYVSRVKEWLTEKGF